MSQLNKQLWSTDLTANDSSAKEELGVLREDYDTTNGRRVFKYVQWDNGAGNLTGAAGEVVYYVPASYAGAKVTPDVSDSDINLVAGVMHVAMTDTHYGWMQVGGKDTIATNGDDDISAYDTIIGGGDRTCNSVAQDTASTNKVLGYALADDDNTADTVSAMLTLEG